MLVRSHLPLAELHSYCPCHAEFIVLSLSCESRDIHVSVFVVCLCLFILPVSCGISFVLLAHCITERLTNWVTLVTFCLLAALGPNWEADMKEATYTYFEVLTVIGGFEVHKEDWEGEKKNQKCKWPFLNPQIQFVSTPHSVMPFDLTDLRSV